jgi:hypothetical protein
MLGNNHPCDGFNLNTVSRSASTGGLARGPFPLPRRLIKPLL